MLIGEHANPKFINANIIGELIRHFFQKKKNNDLELNLAKMKEKASVYCL